MFYNNIKYSFIKIQDIDELNKVNINAKISNMDDILDIPGTNIKRPKIDEGIDINGQK